MDCKLKITSRINDSKSVKDARVYFGDSNAAKWPALLCGEVVYVSAYDRVNMPTINILKVNGGLREFTIHNEKRYSEVLR